MVATQQAPSLSLDIDLSKLKHIRADGTIEYPQYEYFVSQARYAVFFGGIGSSKTFSILFDAFRYAQQYPGSVQMITEPSHDMVKDVLVKKIDEFFGPVVGSAFHMTRSPPYDVTFNNGTPPSVIWLRSAEVEERLKGREVARVHMDEAAIGGDSQQDAFLFLDGRIRQKTDNNGVELPRQLKIAATPKGRNWLWRKFIAEPLPNSQYWKVHTQDAEDAGFLPAGYTETLWANYASQGNTAFARQELEAAFIQMSGQVHPTFGRDSHVRALPANIDPFVFFKQRRGGIDFGGTSPTALVASGIDGTGRNWAYGEWYRPKAKFDDLVSAMSEGEQRWGIRVWVADPSGKEEIEKLNNIGFHVIKARHGNDLKLRYRLAEGRIGITEGANEPGVYFTHEVPNLISEVEQLAWQEPPAGSTEYHVDKLAKGCPDHAWDAWVNTLSDFDAVPVPPKRQTEPDFLWDRSF